MYILVKAILKAKGRNNLFKEINIADMPLQDIFTSFDNGYIHLTNTQLPNPTFVRLNDLKAQALKSGNATFTVWLNSLGAAAIQGSTGEPQIVTRTVAYGLASQRSYEYLYVGENQISGTASDAERVHLDISKKDIPAQNLHQFALTTLNGLMFHSEPTMSGLRIRNARYAKDTKDVRVVSLGLWSFYNVAKVEQIKIQAPMLLKNKSTTALKDEIYIKTNKDFTGKSVMLSFLGKLISVENFFHVISKEEGIVQLKLTNLNLLDWIFTLAGKLDLTHLGINSTEDFPAISRAYLKTDEFLIKALLSPTTFLIVVDSPGLFMEKVAIENVGFPGSYQHPNALLFPMIHEQGFFLDYQVSIKEHHAKYSTVYLPSVVRQFATSDSDLVNGIPESDGKTLAEAHLMRLGCSIMV